jgi:hypothetical protein
VGVMQNKYESAMNLKCVFFLTLFLTPLFAESNKLRVFHTEITISSSCTLYVRPSVLDSAIRFVCKEHDNQYTIEFNKTQEFDSFFSDHKPKVLNKGNGVIHYSVNFESDLSPLHVACDSEICFTVYSKNGKYTSEFHKILKQVLE